MNDIKVETEISPKRPRRIRNSLSRGEIMDCAEEILNSEGIPGLSMRRIADKLGCSVASPYAHFSSIEEIVKGLVLRGEDILSGMIREGVGNAGSGAFDQVAASAHAYWAFSQKYKELHKLMFQISTEISHKKFLKVIPVSYRIFLSTIKKGIEDGEFVYERKSYPSLARTMWAWIYGLIVLDMTGVLSLKKSKTDPLEEGIGIFRELLTNKRKI